MLRGFGAGDVMKHQWPFSYLPLLGCESNRREISDDARGDFPQAHPHTFSLLTSFWNRLGCLED